MTENELLLTRGDSHLCITYIEADNPVSVSLGANGSFCVPLW